MPRPRSHYRAGFSLPEVLIASVVVAIVAIALAESIVAGHQQTDNAVTVHRAAALADSMLERVLALPYADPEGDTSAGPDSGESGYTQFDNVDDYHNYTETAGALIDASGAAWPNDYQGFSRSVRVVSETLDVGELGGTHEGVTVTVTVTMPDGRLLTVRRWVPAEVAS